MHYNNIRWFCIECGHPPDDEEIKIGYLYSRPSEQEIRVFREKMPKEKIEHYWKLRKEMNRMILESCSK